MGKKGKSQALNSNARNLKRRKKKDVSLQNQSKSPTKRMLSKSPNSFGSSVKKLKANHYTNPQETNHNFQTIRQKQK